MKANTAKTPVRDTNSTHDSTVCSMDLYDPESLTSSFELLSVSAADQRNICVSCDDGYYSRSMNSFDVMSRKCCEDVTLADSVSVSEFSQEHSRPNCLDCTNANVDSAFSQDKDGDTDLHTAIIQRQHMLVMWLISVAPGPDSLSIPNRLLQTPLHLAVIMKEGGTVRRLMAAGARVDARDTHGNTPLHTACREGLTDIVSYLLKPVTYAETLANTYQIPYQRIPQDLELFNYDGYSCVHLAAVGTYLDILDLILSRGANVNSREHKSGRTILHFAAETNNLTLMNLLLHRRDLDVDAETYGGLTPLALAAGRRHTSAVHLLLMKGAYSSPLSDNSEDC